MLNLAYLLRWEQPAGSKAVQGTATCFGITSASRLNHKMSLLRLTVGVRAQRRGAAMVPPRSADAPDSGAVLEMALLHLSFFWLPGEPIPGGRA